MTEERDIRINRQRKMEEWLDSSEGYTNSFRRDNSAVELHEKYEGIDKSKWKICLTRLRCAGA